MTSDDPAVRRAATFALATLTFINLFNFLDRFILSAVLESIKESLRFSDTELGLVAGAFIIVFTFASPLFGMLGDRMQRPKLIAIGIAVWSVATMLAGFARGFASLFTARALVGVGEGAYGTIAPALLSDHIPMQRRGRAFAVFFAAVPIGSAAGYVLGGWAEQQWGWRAAFWIAGAPGLLLALLALKVKEAPRGQHDPVTRREYASLLRNRPYRLACLGYAAYTFALGGLAYWTPAFLERVRGLPRKQATVTFGLIVVVTGFLGTFLGGSLGDWLQKFTRQSYLWVCGVATLIAAPLTLVAFTHPAKPVYFTAIVLAEILVFAATGPVNLAIVNAVSATQRATAVGLSVFVMHILGDVPSPPLIGYLSDLSSLEKAFLVVPLAILVAGLTWTWAAWRCVRS